MTGDAVYTATYTSTANQYTVIFRDENGDTLDTGEWAYGATPEYKGKTPAKAEDEGNTYTFAGWTPEIGKVTGDTVYTAVYQATPKPGKCTITVKAEPDGCCSVGGGGVYIVGSDVTVTVLTITEGWEFKAWTENGETVWTEPEYTFTAEENRTLLAKFELRTFTVTFLDEDGKTVLGSVTVPYGGTPVFEGEEPTKAEDDDYTYTFAGWDEELVPVTGAAVYTAVYTAESKPVPEPEPQPEPEPEPQPEPQPEPKRPTSSNHRIATYRVTVAETEHGQVEVRLKLAEKGEKVKITATPEEGYEVESVTVTDAAGMKVEVKENKDGTWTFTQPDSKTTVKVKFRKTDEEPEPEFPFDDVTEDMPCYEDVRYVFDRGIMIGMGETEFGPELSLSRAMIVTALYRLEGEPAVEYKGTFSDVPAGKWYTDPVEWAAEAGIVLGYGDGTYGMNDDVTREQLAAILYRYAVYRGWAIQSAELEAPDGDAVSDWAAEAVAWAAANGILAADEAGAVRPGEAATRAEIAKALHAFLEKVAE